MAEEEAQIAATDTSELLPDMFAFIIGLALAWFLSWETADLVWSLWLASLGIGYLTMMGTLAAGFYLAYNISKSSRFPRKYRQSAAMAIVGGGLFLFCFFTFHFCGFHSGHAIFLSAFFPLPGVEADQFGDAFTNPFLLFGLAFKHVLPYYGMFLIPAVIAERRALLQPLLRAMNTSSAGFQKLAQSAHNFMQLIQNASKNERPEISKEDLQLQKDLRNEFGDPFVGPYKNVIRMHLLIFFFGLVHILKLDGFFTYAVVYFVYFFPWKAYSDYQKGLQAR